jgi:hypothetical protein
VPLSLPPERLNVVLPCYTVATLPDAASHKDWLVRVTDGNVGAPCVAFSDGKHWLRLVAGMPVAAS